jgi:hypothetical protein
MCYFARERTDVERFKIDEEIGHRGYEHEKLSKLFWAYNLCPILSD